MRKVKTTLYRNEIIYFNSRDELEMFLWENSMYVISIEKVLEYNMSLEGIN